MESISEKEYSVLVRLNNSFVMDRPTIGNRVSIDGKEMCGGLFVKAICPHDVRGNKVIRPLEKDRKGAFVQAPGLPDQQLLKKFKFGRIETSNLFL